MKKLLCILFALVLAMPFTLSTAATDARYEKSDALFGDCNNDNSVNAKDLLLLRQYLANYDLTMRYEYADLLSDGIINAKDVLSLRRKLADIPIEQGTLFAREDTDITASLEDLGINNANYYGDFEGATAIISRNPYDLCAFDGCVFVSGGNYNDNMGPVNVNYYTRTSTRVKSTSQLQTEQINRFYTYDNQLFALAVDPNTWGCGEYYVYNQKRGRWDTQPNLQSNIHCYDMLLHGDEYFFAGSNVYYDDRGEVSRGTVYRVDKSKISSYTKEPFTLIPFYDANGELVENTATSVMRTHELMEFRGELYALNYAAYVAVGNTKDLATLGVYKYNEQLQQFDFVKGSSLRKQFETASINGERVNEDERGFKHDFEWNDHYYLINNALYETTDFVNVNTVTVPGYEDIKIQDAIVIADRVYLLGAQKNAAGGYDNVVFETTDMKQFRPILHFNAKMFARSFEYTDGTFFFGLGTTISLIGSDENVVECGRMYRYIYYK